MAEILVVCTANICRSPVAQGLLRDRLDKAGLDDWTVASSGTWAQIERGASRNSIEVMARNGFDISGHRSRMVTEAQLAKADLVLCMEVGHAEALRAEFSDHAGKVFLLTEMVDRGYDVQDPYGGPYQEYERMYETLEQLIDDGWERIVELAEKNTVAE